MCFLWKPGTYVDWKIQIISNARPLLTLGISILPLFALLYIFDFKMKAILYLALFTDFIQQEVLIPVKHDRSLVSHLNQFSSRKSYKAKRSTGCIWIDTYTQRHISIYSPTCSWIWDTEKTYSFWMMWGCGLHGSCGWSHGEQQGQSSLAMASLRIICQYSLPGQSSTLSGNSHE